MPDNEVRRAHSGDLERIVDHFINYLSNTPERDGISPRMRFYGMMPVEAKLLFPDVPDEVFLNAVKQQFDLLRKQTDILPRSGHYHHI